MTVETIYGYKLAVTKNSKRWSQAHMWPFDAQTTKISSVCEQKIKINPMSTMCPCVRMCVKLTISILNAIDALHQQKQWRVPNECVCFSNTQTRKLGMEIEKNAILLQRSLYQLGSDFSSVLFDCLPFDANEFLADSSVCPCGALSIHPKFCELL